MTAPEQSPSVISGLDSDGSTVTEINSAVLGSSGLQADDLPIRDELRSVTAYGAPQLDVPVRLNTNENPFPPSPALVADIAAAIADAAGGLQRYPDRDALGLRGALAAYLSASCGVDVSPEAIWAANGSNEILQQLLQTFGGPGRVAMGFEPSYSMHALISRGTGTDFVAVPRSADFTVDVAASVAAIQEHKPAVVFVCSPNNPTGTAVDLTTISRLYEAVTANELGVLVVDEAYEEFSSSVSAVTLLPGRPRLIVSRTMSKAFAFAGARVGYFAADPAVVDAVMRVRLPYHLSALTQVAAQTALTHTDELLAAVEVLKVQRDRIVSACRDYGLPVAASDANFVLFGGLGDQRAVWQAFLDRGVLIRDVGLGGWLRVTAGTPEETTAFIDALRAIIEADRGPRTSVRQEQP